MDFWYYSLIAGVIGLVFAVYLTLKVMKESRGTKEVDEISRAIEIGAIAFLMREYKTLIWFVAIVAIVLGVALEPKGWVACAYLMGTVLSVTAGYVGMRVGTRANCRTVTAVVKSLNNGLRVAFMSGAVMGLTTVSLGLIGLSLVYIIWNGEHSDISNVMVGFGFGASSIALFARVGGGIYTKGADVGSDLVGK
ncbi:MAG: sodium/proton-translocating pyrophosphatase, partial [Chloroflexi bacterium]|nr:sodium/proton-translocating pyrophosphatase [Chloroflexota bacterium]